MNSKFYKSITTPYNTQNYEQRNLVYYNSQWHLFSLNNFKLLLLFFFNKLDFL